MGLPDRGGQEEPGQDERPCQQAAGQDQDLQEADRGGRGDCRPQPGQVQEGPAGAGGDRGKGKACRGPDPSLRSQSLLPLLTTSRSPIVYSFFQKKKFTWRAKNKT